jgi:hypothetical protein
MRSDELRRRLGRRVTARLAGRGVACPDVEAAVARVVDVLTGDAAPSVLAGLAASAKPGADAPLIAAFTAPARPDLASRVRALLLAVGVDAVESGSARAGRHAAVAVRIPAAARDAVSRAAASAAVLEAFADAGVGEGS